MSVLVGTNVLSVEDIAEISTNYNAEFTLESRLTEAVEESRMSEIKGELWVNQHDFDSGSRELDICETRALILVKATNIAMGSRHFGKKLMKWLIEQLRHGSRNSLKLKHFDSDEKTLSYLLSEYLKLTGDQISKNEANIFLSGFSATSSQLGLYLGVCSSLRYYGECVLALLMESMSFPICFLTHLSVVSTEGLSEITRDMKWLLEDSKIQREPKWVNQSVGIKLTHIICSLGNLHNSIESLSKCVKGFFSKNPTISYKGIDNSIDCIELMPVFEPIKRLVSSLMCTRKSCLTFMEELVPTIKESIAPSEYLDFKLDDSITVKGLDILKIIHACKPITHLDIEYINSRIKFFNAETEVISGYKLSDLDVSLSEIISMIKKLLNSNLEMFTIFNLISLHELSCKNLLQYFASIEKARKKGKTEILLSSHESKNIHAFRRLILDFLSAIEDKNYNNIYQKLFTNLQDSLIYKLFQKLKLISTPQNQTLRIPKVPKGTQDTPPHKMSIKNLVLEIIRDVYRAHGAVEIDTPVFELKDTLLGKYGEESKLIYDLKDQGGEQLSLRYDLTVPLARYIATSGLDHLKRYQIGKVYRRDEPQMSRGRFREFYQCDLDIVGKYDLMVPDAEIINIATEVLLLFSKWIGKFIIKINHRLLLNGILEISGVPKEKFKTICSSIDKLDKETWENVRKEMIDVKGLSTESTDKIGRIINISGNPHKVINEIKSNKELISNQNISRAITDIELLFKYASNCTEYLSFDLSLARGLDYYTGVIYEAVLVREGDSNNANQTEIEGHCSDINVGTIAAGGRYDELIGMFSQKSVPAVGFSVGIERIMSIIEKKLEKNEKTQGKGSFTDFLVCNIGDSYIEYRLKVASLLWKNRISCEISFTGNGKLRKQIDFASNNNIPFCIIIGEDEVKSNTVQIKQIQHNNNTSDNFSKEVNLNDLLDYINQMFNNTSGSTYSKFKSEFCK